MGTTDGVSPITGYRNKLSSREGNAAFSKRPRQIQPATAAAMKVGAVIRKMAKHFALTITNKSFVYQADVGRTIDLAGNGLEATVTRTFAADTL
jgi:hypothetical protein